MIKTVGMIGHGAVGVLFARQFLDALDADDLMIISDQERIRRYQTEGVYVNGQKCAFRYVPFEEAKPVDLLIFAVKETGLADALSLAHGAVGENTIVLSFLNGLDSEQKIEEALHPSRLLYCTVQGMDATRTGNEVIFHEKGSISFGEKDNTRSQAVCEVEDFLKRAHVAYQIPDDIIHQQWNKWMLNVGVNQACAVYAVGYAGVQVPGEPREAMIAAMEEARTVAVAEGVILTEQERDAWIAMIDSLSGGEPSMRQDTREGRPTEVEIFAGFVRKLGEKHKIAVPWNEKFYQILSRY